MFYAFGKKAISMENIFVYSRFTINHPPSHRALSPTLYETAEKKLNFIKFHGFSLTFIVKLSRNYEYDNMLSE